MQDSPLVVRQHFEPPRKFVILTAQGAHIFTKLRPVDLLQQLLVECRGPDNDAVKTFFTIQKEDQACATSLILACIENIQKADVVEWATRAFFIYGGEPRPTPPPNFNQTNPCKLLINIIMSISLSICSRYWIYFIFAKCNVNTYSFAYTNETTATTTFIATFFRSVAQFHIS